MADQLRTKKPLRELFLELPGLMRDWLTSDEATDHVIDINKRFGFTDDLISIVPMLVTRLVIKDLKPSAFLKELGRGLLIEEETARQVAEEIKAKILLPIQSALGSLGIDINAFGKSETEPATQEIRTEVQAVPPTTPPTSPQVVVPQILTSVKIEPPEAVIAPAESPVRESTEAAIEHPFILHEEKPFIAPQEPPEKPSFTFRPTEVSPAPAKPKPVTVKIETPEDKEENKQPPTKRVVHYSEFRTPLDES